MGCVDLLLGVKVEGGRGVNRQDKPSSEQAREPGD